MCDIRTSHQAKLNAFVSFQRLADDLSQRRVNKYIECVCVHFCREKPLTIANSARVVCILRIASESSPRFLNNSLQLYVVHTWETFEWANINRSPLRSSYIRVYTCKSDASFFFLLFFRTKAFCFVVYSIAHILFVPFPVDRIMSENPRGPFEC